MKSTFFNRVVWAVDALEEGVGQKKGLALLRSLAKVTQAEIIPVYILTAPYADSSSALSSNFEQAFQALAEKRMEELRSQSGISSMKSGKVLFSRKGSTRKDVQVLIDFAEQQEADAIVLATHARSGISRLFMGSFAETLAMHSPVPLLTENPDVEVREKISKVLYPTNFHKMYRLGFERVVEFAKIMESKLTLFYQEPIIAGAFMSPEIYKYIEKENRARREIALEWKKWAEDKGVEAEVYLEEKPASIGQAIDDFAKGGQFDIIAMLSEADEASAVVMGSITRQVVRQAPCPVWIMRIGDESK